MDGDIGDDGVASEQTWVRWVECDGEWLGRGWRNEAASCL